MTYKPNVKIEGTDKEKVRIGHCVACLSEIPRKAKICKECGTRQNNASRNFFRFAAIAAVVATVLSLATTGIALAPVAYGLIFRHPEPRLIELDFDHEDPSERTLGVFSLFNSGNTDAFVTKVVFSPTNEIFEGVGDSTFSIFKMLEGDKGFEEKIGYPFSQYRKKFPTPPLEMSERTFPIALVAISEAAEREKTPTLNEENCFMLVPHDASLGLGPKDDGVWRNASTVTSLTGTLYYLDRKNPEEILHTDIEHLYMEAAVFLHPFCIHHLGGLQLVEELLKSP